MKFLRLRKLNKHLDSGRVVDVLPFLEDDDEKIVARAWMGVRNLIARKPALSDDNAVSEALRRFLKRAKKPVASQVWKALFRSSLPELIRKAAELVNIDRNSEEGEAALEYLLRIAGEQPAPFGKACEDDPGLLHILVDTAKEAETIGDPKMQGAVRFFEFLDIWRDSTVSHECFQLFCRSRFSENPELMGTLMTRLADIQQTKMVEPLLYQYGTSPDNKELGRRVDETIGSLGEAARETLVRVVEEYKGSIPSQNQSKVERTPAYYASQKALELLNVVVQESDKELIVFLTDVVADTKLDHSGMHKRRARDLLDRLT